MREKPKRKTIDSKADLLAGMREIYEVWAGSDGFEPVTAPEAYQQRLIFQMRDIAAKFLFNKNKGDKMLKCPNCGTNNVKRQLSGGQLCSHCNTIAHINKVDKKIRRLKDKKRIMNILNSFKMPIATSWEMIDKTLEDEELLAITEDDFEEVADAIIKEV